ncbi:hypothetical protein LWI28_026725 [Acer negundo]|uniref:Uncharacterized protein n=1 Tax=Acer negundo TaxID=4023 RepID=A0AAD5IJR0_ACENE|nr:hypothetical protein LWI28_026725 [Acer negundo]
MVTRSKVGVFKQKTYNVAVDASCYLAASNPTTSKVALKNLKWVQAMKEKFKALEANNTWTLITSSSTSLSLNLAQSPNLSPSPHFSQSRKPLSVTDGFESDKSMNLTDKEAPIESSSSSTSSLERLNEGLSLFDAILIVPMFQITWTFFSIFSALHNTTLLMHLQFLSCLWCHQSMQAFEETRLTEQRSSPSEMLANVDSYDEISRILKVYEEGSWQMVNLQKLNITFNPNVSSALRAEIPAVFEVGNAQTYDKYIGLSTLGCKNKKENL